MKKKILSLALAIVLLLSASFIGATIPVSADRSWNYSYINSPDGIIYPDIQIHKNKFLKNWYNLCLNRGPIWELNKSSNFEHNIIIPDTLDAKITDEFIDKIVQSLEKEINFLKEFGDFYSEKKSI